MADGAARGHLAHHRGDKPAHLADAVAAVDLELSAAEVDELGADYVPHAVAGHR